MTHYGVMIPDLPEPHFFYSIMSILGTSGALVFDNDFMLKDIPRNNATVVFGTGAENACDFSSYSMPKECEIAEDGSKIKFGNDLIISGTYPHFIVHSENEHYSIDLKLEITDKVTYFVKTPIYDHISLLAKYQGTIRYQDNAQEISGLCTFEHAAAFTPHLLWKNKLANNLKLPVDFFTYQIINLDEETQLLLVDARINGSKIVSKAYLRGLSTYNKTFEAELNVIQYQDQIAISPDGVEMKLPQVFEWRVLDDSQEILYIKGTVNTAFNYGLGSGYVGGYSYIGNFREKEIQGQAYIEYIDRM